MLHRPLSSILLALGLGVAAAPAAVTYSGIQNVTIPADFDGVYIDFTNPLNAKAYTTAATEPGTWDLNPFFGGAAIGTSDTFLPATDTGATNSEIQNYAAGVGIGTVDADTFVSDFSGSIDHMGGGAGQFGNGSEGYFGFRISDGASGTYYGWARVTLSDDGTTGTLHDWAWDTSGNTIIVGVPEPGSVVLLAFGGMALLRRRRA